MKNFTCIVLLMVCGGMSLTAQVEKSNGVVERIKPVVVKAEVVGILQGHKALAVLQIQKTDSVNALGLKPQQEILVEFVFGTQKTDDPQLPGVKGGTLITAQLAGNFNPATGQHDYRVFKYHIRSKEKTAAPAEKPPQK